MISVIGNGSWATALVKILTDNGQQVSWWMRTAADVDAFNTSGRNNRYLSSVSFEGRKPVPTADLNAVVEKSAIILMCVPSAYIGSVLAQLPANALKDKIVVSAIKGILPGCDQLLQDYLSDNFDFPSRNYVSVMGPCHAEEIAEERLSYLTFSANDITLGRKIAEKFVTKYVKTTVNNDLWGSQYAAVLKNVYALAAGMAIGLGYGDNFQSVLITNCYSEMFRFLKFHFEYHLPDAPLPDFMASVYLGDLLVTCYSPHSRNRRFGTMIGQGYSPEEAKESLQMVAEGYYAVRGMKQVLARMHFNMPILMEVFQVLWQNKPAEDAFAEIERLLH